MWKIRSTRYRFIYDAYFYAEVPIEIRKVLKIIERIENNSRFRNKVVEDYTLDVLAGRVKPMTQQVIKRLNGGEIA